MHTLLILASLTLALAGCLVCMALLRVAHSSSSRRALQLAGMLFPVFVLGLLATLMVHFLSQACFLTSPPVDMALSKSLLVIGTLGIVIAVALNLLRAMLLPLHLRRKTWDAPTWLQDRVAKLTPDAKLQRPPRVRVAADAQPWALVAGIVRPHLVISSGLVVLLDEEELSAVICHELMHIRRGDVWWTAFGGILRDLTWFLPATRRLYKKLLVEQEVACDDRVTGEPRRLALASALARVWQAELGSGLTPRGALPLFSPEQSANYEARVSRLMERPGNSQDPARYRAMLAVVLVLGLFIPAQVGAALLAMDNMGCGLHQLLSVIIH